MAKQGMKRPSRTHIKPRNSVPAVPEIQGKAKQTKGHAAPVAAGTKSPSQKVWHSTENVSSDKSEKPIPDIYPELDTDLGRDNLENDIPDADLQDLDGSL